MISQLAAYTYPPHFKNPLKFDPSRWLGNAEYDFDNKDVYQPFSVGPRNCVGKNLAWIKTKIILAKMLWNFDLELLDDNFEPQRQKMYILWQKPELLVRVKVRPGA
jgi:cytochrome P450